jgi:hypothetical protein
LGAEVSQMHFKVKGGLDNLPSNSYRSGVKSFRTPFITALFFCLISLGQAYPLSVAWGISKQTHSCCCSGVTKTCACDHSHARAASHQDKNKYQQTSCGDKTESQILGFQWDPFLKDPKNDFSMTSEEIFVDIPGQLSSHLKLVPDSPPPKALS